MTSRLRTRGSYKKSEVSRRQVLDAAVRALSTQGYASTSVSDIASAAGMSKGAVHYHFDSKDDLIAKVLEHCAAVTRGRMREAWDAPGAPSERIQRAIRELREMRRTNLPEMRVLVDLAAQAAHDPRLRMLMGQVFEANRKEIVDHLSRSMAEIGLQPKVPVNVVVRLLLGALDGLAIHDYFDRPSAADEEALERTLVSIGFSLFEM